MAIAFSLFAPLFSAAPSFAVDITVDADCALADAITAANTDEAVGGCTAGAGADVISLSAELVLEAELPRVTTEISIDGGGHSISGEGAHRILFVEAGGILTIEQLTLVNGKASEVRLSTAGTVEAGGAILNQGVLHVNNSRFTDNAAKDGGGILNMGELSISRSTFSGNSAELAGGAILNAGTLDINESTFHDNSAKDGGVLYNTIGGELYAYSSVIFFNTADRVGGAIFNDGTLYVNGNNIVENSADAGGAIYNDSGGELNVIGGTFHYNIANQWGGAILNKGELSVRGGVFGGNSAAFGGALHNHQFASINNATLSDNNAEVGGAINTHGKLSVRRSTFTENTARFGGAINNSETDSPGELTVITSIFSANSAFAGGAIVNNGELDIFNSQFSNNSAQSFGGAISHTGILNVDNSSFYGNAAEQSDNSAENDDSVEAVGGSLLIIGTEEHRSTVTLTHLTFARDRAEGGGDSISVQSTGFAVVNLRNSIIAGDTGAACLGPLAENVGNLIEDGSCDAETSGDPMLGELVEPETGSPAYFPLLPGSPAIDAAMSDFCLEIDQIGRARPQDEACDIGALEYVQEE